MVKKREEGSRTYRAHNMIDIHAHVLPGVDDGARTTDEACELVEQAVRAGFRAVIATPHYSRRRGAEGCAEAAEKLQEAIRRCKADNSKNKIPPEFELYLGQETYYHEELVDNLKAGKALTMAGSRYVLIEFDTGVSFQTMNRAMRRLLTAGYVPILAHMERYACLREVKNLDSICKSGCLMQMNYESLEGHWFSREVRWCRKQVQEGRIQFLGTDMHRTDYRPPQIEKAMAWLEKAVTRKKLSKHLLKTMTYRNAEKMLRNEKI